MKYWTTFFYQSACVKQKYLVYIYNGFIIHVYLKIIPVQISHIVNRDLFFISHIINRWYVLCNKDIFKWFLSLHFLWHRTLCVFDDVSILRCTRGCPHIVLLTMKYLPTVRHAKYNLLTVWQFLFVQLLQILFNSFYSRNTYTKKCI